MRRALQALLSALFPQRLNCHACGTPLRSVDALLCEACVASLAYHRFAPHEAETLVDSAFAFAASAYRYGGAAAALVKALKFQSDYTAALPLAEGMAAVYAATPALREPRLCVPVPVHYRRLRMRGYNQAWVLARAFCEQIGAQPPVEALVRVHHKRSQVWLSREARRGNIRGAFAVHSAMERAVRGQRVLLVDDVLTTGATATDCAEALLAAGAAEVMLLTACRA